MKVETKNRKKAMAGFRQMSSEQQQRQQVHEIIQNGAQALHEATLNLGRQLAEFILYSEREERAGPDCQPRKEGLYKWASEPGSVYIGGQKVRVERRRLRRGDKEVRLKSCQAMQQSEGFSEQLLGQSLAGLSGRRYRETLVNAAEALGVWPSAVSERLVEATTQKFKEFRERRLEDFAPVALFLDTVHRGGMAFVVALGLDIQGQKRVLGFWEGATENAEVAETLLADLEERGRCCARGSTRPIRSRVCFRACACVRKTSNVIAVPRWPNAGSPVCCFMERKVFAPSKATSTSKPGWPTLKSNMQP